MPSEFEDVLTNQPVVIDNVSTKTFERQAIEVCLPHRARAPSRPALQEATLLSLSSPICEFSGHEGLEKLLMKL